MAGKRGRKEKDRRSNTGERREKDRRWSYGHQEGDVFETSPVTGTASSFPETTTAAASVSTGEPLELVCPALFIPLTGEPHYSFI